MQTAPTDTPRDQNLFAGFDQSMERVLGADMRLIYGFAVPVLMIVGLIIVLALRPETWLVVCVMVLECAALALVVAGIVAMLNEREDDSDSVSQH
jgi:Na+-translocating ferredoxin:NAD+ oxidoreductase RnfD subunit